MLVSKKILKIDLTSFKVIIENIPKELLKSLLGGKGINIYYVTGLIDRDALPLGEDNSLIFSSDLLEGRVTLSFLRINIGAILPLSWLIGSSNAGSFL